MLTPDVLRRIRRIEFKTRRLVTNAFAGAYHSVYKGRGLSFAAVRPYVPGDDVRSIDWKVTARTGEPFIRQHVEERELTVMLVIDGSASVLFGTIDRQKRDFAAELGAALAYMAITNNDRAGLLIFSDKVEHYVPPRKGRKHILRLIRDLLTIETSGNGTDLAQALRTLNRVLPSGAIIFLLSDFLMSNETYYQDLAITARNHELNVVILSDPLEESFPEVGMMGLRDAETGAIQWVDTASSQWQQQFRQQQRQFAQERDLVLKRAGVARIDIPPDGDYARALSLFFHQQLGRRR
jgi:uncharacterized protein (DUF58 family)